jgi:hypothetical protein
MYPITVLNPKLIYVLGYKKLTKPENLIVLKYALLILNLSEFIIFV